MRTYFKKGDKLTVIIIIKKCNAVFIKVETKNSRVCLPAVFNCAKIWEDCKNGKSYYLKTLIIDKPEC